MERTQVIYYSALLLLVFGCCNMTTGYRGVRDPRRNTGRFGHAAGEFSHPRSYQQHRVNSKDSMHDTLHTSQWEFYTALSTNLDLTDQQMRAAADDDVISEITDNVQTFQPNLCRKDRSSPGSKFSVFHQLMCILHKPDFHKTDFPIEGRDYSVFLQKQLAGGSVLEIGSGVTALSLSTSNATLAALIYPEYELAEKAYLARKKNVSLMTLSLPKMLKVIDQFQSDPQVMFSTIIISNISALVSNHLPDELELLLSKIFSLAQETYVALDTLQDPMMKSFFSYWTHQEDLLDNSCSVPGMISCSVDRVFGSPPLYKVVPSQIIRKMSSSVCNRHQECKLVYKHTNDSDEHWLQALNWKSIITLPSCGIPLHVMLQLGLLSQGREFVMTPLLETNMNLTHVTSRDLCVSRQGIQRIPKHTKILDIKKEEELKYQSAIISQILQTSETQLLESENQQPFDTVGVPEPPLSRSKPLKLKKVTNPPEDSNQTEEETFLKKEPNIANTKVEERGQVNGNNNDQGHGGVDEKLRDDDDDDDDVETDRTDDKDVDMNALQQEVNQEDGVAHLWQREMGVVDDSDRINQAKGALNKMGEQWDREKEDHAVGIMSEQYKWAAIDRLWTRDEGDEADIVMVTGDGSRPGMQEGGQVYKYDQELGKMIGSLNDDDNHGNEDGGKHGGMTKTRKESKLKFDDHPKEPELARTTGDGNITQLRRQPVKSGIHNPNADGMNEDFVQRKETVSKHTVKYDTKPPVVEQRNYQELPKEVHLQEVQVNQERLLKRKGDKKPKLQELLRKPNMKEPIVKANEEVGDVQKVYRRHLLELEEVKTGDFYTKPRVSPSGEDKDASQPAPDDNEEEEETNDEDADDEDVEEPEDESTDLMPETDDSQGVKLDRKTLYTSEWSQIEEYFQHLNTDQPFSLLTYGLEQQSSLSAKICRSYPSASVVTVIPEAEADLVEHHRKLQDSLELRNNILVNTDLSDKVVHDLYHLPEVFKYQILGLSVFNKAASLGSLFPLYLGRLISLAETTFLEVPPPQTLALATVLLRNPGHLQDEQVPVFKGFIHQALHLAGIKKSTIELLEEEMPNGIKLLKIHISQGIRPVKQDCSSSFHWLHYNGNQAVTLSDSAAAAKGGSPLDRATKAITLKTLLTLGLPSLERKQLFFRYFATSLHNDMCPVNLVWMQGRLLYNTPRDKLPSDLSIDKQKDATIQGLMGLLSSQLDPEPFSFLDYGSGKGSLSIALASKYTNSSIISMGDDVEEVENHFKQVKKLGLWNNVITHSMLDLAFSQKLVESPDFLRYQFIGTYQYLLLLRQADSPDSLATLVGNLLSSAVTTFIQVPSSQALSLAVATFFPEMLNGTKFIHMTPQERFLRASHPLGLYRNAEIHLIKEGSFGPSVDVNVSSQHVLHPADGSVTWSLLRVDVRKLNITVFHHFDYKQDGHSRTYILHCNSNETDYEVHLIRENDGFKIPYGQISAFSLIALLRMGLVTEMKERFYTQFLHLPLYEDMAPWNIVFQGGSLQYIDYDTKDFTLDKVVPMAYQVMALLLNYERTVRDFGHCNFHAGNQYGIDYVSHCVGSQYNGPCTDSRYPVPCADRTCKPTYIDCLKTLSEMEQKLSGYLKGSSKIDAGMMAVENNGLTSDYNSITTEEEEWQLSPK